MKVLVVGGRLPDLVKRDSEIKLLLRGSHFRLRALNRRVELVKQG